METALDIRRILLYNANDALKWADAHPVLAALLGIVMLCAILGSKTILGPPIAIFLYVVIFAEVLLYFAVRHIVYLLEILFLGSKYLEVGHLQAQARSAETFEEWNKVSSQLDVLEGRDEWKKIEKCNLYDWKWVKHATSELKAQREANNPRKLVSILQMCLRKNLGGVMKEELYSLTRTGTKKIVENYIDEIEEALNYLRNVEDHEDFSQSDKLRFFYAAYRSFGNVALCLSGGAGLGKYHFGVVKALLDVNQLPRVISGTSAGAVVACIVCTRTDEELRKLLQPNSTLQPNLNSFTEGWVIVIKRFIQTGAMYDFPFWLKLLQWHTKGLTFQEAYERTGRILNITTTIRGRDETLVLNHITTPNVLISTAVLASSAVPGFMKGVQLYEKDRRTGEIQPHHWSSSTKLLDGSFSMDIPTHALSEMFNVHFFIASQVNPHVIPFFFNNRGEGGAPSQWRKRTGGWRGGFILSALELYLKNDLKKNVRLLSELRLLPRLLGNNWGDLWVQEGDFQGHCTIVPKARLLDYFKLVSDPTREEFEAALRESQVRTWEKFSMLYGRFKIGNTLKKNLHELMKKAGPQHPSPTPSPSSFTQELSGEEEGLSFAYGKDMDFESSTFLLDSPCGQRKVPLIEKGWIPR